MEKKALLTRKLPQNEVEIPDVGTVVVRAMTRAEAFFMQKAPDTEGREQRMIAAGMVDPPMDLADAKEWQENSVAGDLELVTNEIGRLSKMLEDSGKEAYKSVRGKPRS